MNQVSFAGLNVWVIGDIMLDRYIYGQVDRISPEAPVPVMTYRSTTEKPGGAANVALNCQGLGAQVRLMGILGNDPEAESIIQLLLPKQIEVNAFGIEDRPTTVKTRLMSQKHQMLRIDREETEPLSLQEEEIVLNAFEQVSQNPLPDVIILQDYDKGSLFPRFIKKVINFAVQHHIPVTADPKNRNFFAYKGVSLFKPNRQEIQTAMQLHLDPEKDALGNTCKLLQSKMPHERTLITLGSHGMYIHTNKASNLEPAKPIEVYDVCGAGDTVISVASLSLVKGLNEQQIVELCTNAAAWVCMHPGVVAVDQKILEY